MGIIKKGILGGFKGKVGTVVGYQIDGQDVMRAVPNVRSVPFTENELKNQKCFGDLQSWLQPITGFLRVGFQGYAPTFRGFNAARSYNATNALVKDGTGAHIDPALALVSFGNMEQATTASAMSEAPNSVTFNWEGGRYMYDDRAMFLVYDIAGKKATFDTAAVKRSAMTGTLTLDPAYSDREVHVYLAFVSEDRKTRSNSQYLGAITVL